MMDPETGWMDEDPEHYHQCWGCECSFGCDCPALDEYDEPAPMRTYCPECTLKRSETVEPLSDGPCPF